MEPGRWKRIEELFERVLPLAPERRGELLDVECEGDPELRREVEEMLEGEAASSWIGASVRRTVLDELQDETPPERIGPYRIVREIGRGGLATVFLGERDDDEYRMQVAIKLVRRGLDTADLLSRLRQERQILARLNHPNIASLMDGGTTTDGRPYVVMEFIDGEPIDLYCRKNRLSLPHRLRLFIEVCHAVAYAHRNLVIHRDIKPANILVTSEGKPKLLDFGIAKLLQPDLHEPRHAAHTLPGLRLLTPEYASPEQVRGEGLNTSTDVYSLGVLLYELLVGERPYRLPTRDLAALEQVICTEEPEPPSLRARRPVSPKVGEEEAVLQILERVRVPAKSLKGDLDTIILTALNKEPERRYPSVEQLAEDVDRYLGNQPIRARRSGWVYHLGKFIKRHRTAVVGTSFLILFLIGASVFSSRQAYLAKLERQRSEEITEFIIRFFEVSDPNRPTGAGSEQKSRGETITAREVLDQGAELMENELIDQPVTLAALTEAVGRIYRNLGLYDRAEDLFEKSLTERRKAFGDDHPEVASSLNYLGEARFDLGDFQASLALIEEAYQIRRRSLGEEDPATSASRNNLAALYFSLGHLERAEDLFRLNLETRRRILGPKHGDVANAMVNLATVLERNGELEESEGLYSEALELRSRLLGPEHPEVAKAQNNLATLLFALGRHQEAEKLYRRALSTQMEALGKEHPQVAVSAANLAALLRDRGGDQEAEDLLRTAIHIQKRHLGPRHIRLSYPLINLADLLRLSETPRGLAQAQALYREALDIRRHSLPAGHLDLAAPLEGLARLELARRDDLKEGTGESLEQSDSSKMVKAALELAREAAEIRRGALAPDHPTRIHTEELLEHCRRLAEGSE